MRFRVFFAPKCNPPWAPCVLLHMEKELYINLLQEHRNCIYSLAIYSLRDADDAADITQETFLRLWRYDGDLSANQAKAWLIRVCHNLCIDHARRRKTVRTYFGVPDHEAVENLKGGGAGNDDPEMKLQKQQQQQALLNSLAILPAETRSIMMLHYFQDLKIQEIASLLGLKASTIKVRLHRARNSLKLHLNDNNIFPLSYKRETG